MLNRFLIIISLFLSVCGAEAAQTPFGLLLEFKGPIGPATSDYFQRAIEKAADKKADLVVIRMDTPGGLDSAMREIIKEILASPVPVVVYVAPEGARAASAGTYILYASHIAAMAPATNLGAATPVPVAGPISMPPGDRAKDAVPQKDAKTEKVINDAVAYIRGLAQMRGRNVEWAEKAVREAASLSAEDALQLDVINIIATSDEDLLQQLDGRIVTLKGQEVSLNTKGLTLESYEPDWRTQFLAVITDPNVAYILMLIGIYGIIFELANPGTIISGVIGGICLLLALYAFQVLPVNYAGLALMLFGIAMMVGEAMEPGFGILGFGGMIAFVAGSIILMDTEAPGFGVSPALIGIVALLSSITFFLVISLAMRARKRPVVVGQEEFIGSFAEVLGDFEHKGKVRFEGELWKAQSTMPVKQGQKVRVVAIDGLVLHVEPGNEEADTNGGV